MRICVYVCVCVCVCLCVWLSSPTESVLKTAVGLMGEGKLASLYGSENCLIEYNKEEILHNRSTYFT